MEQLQQTGGACGAGGAGGVGGLRLRLVAIGSQIRHSTRRGVFHGGTASLSTACLLQTTTTAQHVLAIAVSLDLAMALAG